MNLASLYIEWGRYDLAERQRMAAPMSMLTETSDISQALGVMASLAAGRGDLTRAQAAYEENLAFLRRNGGPECELQVSTTLNNIGSLDLRRERWESAEGWLQMAVKSQRAASGDSHPNLTKVLGNLAVAQMKQRKWREAEASVQEGLTISRASLGQFHPLTAAYLDLYATILESAGRKKEAREVRREAESLRRQIPPPLPGGLTVDLSTLRSFTKSSDPGNSANARKQTKQPMPASISAPRRPN
ncbi:MAG: tetratricopeptide repeat protein [Bryobacteraceae bacterium]|nr:tetratricopeptide repeat protein [Bryobacteraceae bacterium]